MTKALKGTNVAAAIVPFTDSDNYATHYALYGKGGFRSVNTIAERDAIPSARCEEGMVCYVINDPDKFNTYQFIEGKWERSSLGASVDSVKNKEELAKRPELKKEGQMIFLLDTEEMLIYSPTRNEFVSTGNVRIQDTEPLDDSVMWVDSGEKCIPDYTNEDLISINEAIEEIRYILQQHEFAFNNVMSPGNFTNNLKNDMANAADPEKPEDAEDPSKENEIAPPGDDPNGPEYPEFADGVFPNLKHLCIKMGSFTTMSANKNNYVDGELLWCSDTKQLYIMSKGSLIWLNKAGNEGGSGGGSLDYTALDKLDTIGFKSESGQIYRVKVNNNGELLVYKKELDTPQTEPSGGTTDTNGWVYVTTLFLQKLYINSVYCGGISSNEHSYNYCSHNFVELSNLTTADISLNGLSLQYGSDGTTWEVLPLWGTIKAQSTFLIRGAQCSVMDVNTTRIKVKTFDMEWRASNGELIKFDNNKAKFFLTWGTEPSTVKSPYVTVTVTNEDDGTESSVIRVSKGYIDLVGLQKQNASTTDTIDASEKSPYGYLDSNKLFTKYYAMDPVSQATKALSARNNANDWYFVDLSKDLIPSVEAFTPKASYENKTIFYNKSKLSESGPNLISITFGIQATAPNATRCFNWVSVGYYDEYIWYCSKGSGVWKKVESFKNETGYRKYYNRIRMEATDGTAFTTHKAIIKNLAAGTYQYKVGRALSNGEPDVNYTSKVLEFTVRDEVDSFKFVQVSDQQGFNWDEYTVWKIAADYIKTNIPDNMFTINTGDLTQNGNRINEWIDYYNSRESLRSLEEMTTIGNNDLCPENIYVLGNGGDASKINSTNMSFFYTYEIDEDNPPIFSIEGKEVYIESLYSFNFGNTHFICLNSEISEMTETDIYKLSKGAQTYSYIKSWCERDIEKHKDKTWKIAYCHEMPFTIMTQNLIQNFYWNKVEDQTVERAGSRINTNNSAENKYWFSRFCQDNGIRLVLCGHKHTQTCSWPLLENVNAAGKVISMKPIIQVTSNDLSTYFDSTDLYEETEGDLKGYKYPSAWRNNANYEQHKHLCTFQKVDKITAPVYFMSQATGYKHTSNKELPAPGIPWLRRYFPAKVEVVDQKTITATVNAGQRYPFYTEWEISPTRITGTVKKLNYVFDSKGKYNINLKSSSNPPTAIGGNGEANGGDDKVIIDL